ncbi:MAG: sugar ABC transporter permease [Clostridia bacterium]|nr:sugar ABC transporter permease [Clostridia bacterium]
MVKNNKEQNLEISTATTATVVPALKKRKRRSLSVERKQSFMGYIFCLPFIIGLIALYIPNIIDTVVFSFNDTIILDGGGYRLEWLGLRWYNHSLFVDEKFIQLLWSSIGEMLVQVPTIVVFSLFFASVLNQEFRGRVVARAIFFLPVVLATGIVLRVDNAFDLVAKVPSRDTLNDAIGTVGASGVDITEFLLSMNLGEDITKFLATTANGVYDIVNRSGMQIFILLAAFQEIPNSLYEAAQVEGCSKWETFWKITIPMVSKQIVVVTVYTIIDSFTRNDSALFLYIDEISWNGSPYAYATSMYIIYIVVLAALLGGAAFIASRFMKKSKR